MTKLSQPNANCVPNKMSELVLFGRTDLAVLNRAIPLCVGATSTQTSNPAKKIGGEASVCPWAEEIRI